MAKGEARRRGYVPPIWYGMTLPAWLSLLWRNGFRVTPRCIPRCLLISVASVVNSVLAAIDWTLFDLGRSRPAPVQPLFVVGQPRSGTTLLHQLLALDPRHGAPSGLACFTPAHFRLTGPLLGPLLSRLLPSKRPIDDMDFNLTEPQEDEFAILLGGAVSPAETLAFPDASPRYVEQLAHESMPASRRRKLAGTLDRFLRRVARQQPGRRLVMKSPFHMARLGLLAELYPDLKVIHIVREPEQVVASSLPSRREALRLFALQRVGGPRPDVMMSRYRFVWERLMSGSKGLPKGAFHEVRYEDLVADPHAALDQIYERLGLGDFTPLADALTRHLETRSLKLPPRRDLPADFRQSFREAVAPIVARYGYDDPSPARCATADAPAPGR